MSRARTRSMQTRTRSFKRVSPTLIESRPRGWAGREQGACRREQPRAKIRRRRRRSRPTRHWSQRWLWKIFHHFDDFVFGSTYWYQDCRWPSPDSNCSRAGSSRSRWLRPHPDLVWNVLKTSVMMMMMLLFRCLYLLDHSDPVWELFLNYTGAQLMIIKFKIKTSV